jgi:hypothetical protein
VGLDAPGNAKSSQQHAEAVTTLSARGRELGLSPASVPSGRWQGRGKLKRSPTPRSIHGTLDEESWNFLPTAELTHLTSQRPWLPSRLSQLSPAAGCLASWSRARVSRPPSAELSSHISPLRGLGSPLGSLSSHLPQAALRHGHGRVFRGRLLLSAPQPRLHLLRLRAERRL